MPDSNSKFVYKKKHEQFFCPINSISHVSFTNLIRINLSFNNIESVEGLAHLDMEKLEELNLTNNLIASLKALNNKMVQPK
jgi:Leucine-rich repeat (LRR) protein